MSLTVSWSMLRTHEECRQKALLMRTGKRSPLADKRQYFHGTVVDRVMRAWLQSGDPQPGEMVEMVEDIAREQELEALVTGDGVVRWRGRNDKAVMMNFCRELVRRLEPILFELVVPFEYQPAVRFRVPVSVPWLDGTPTEIFMAGEIDVITRDSEGVFRAYDLKGTADDSYIRKTLGQGIFYDLSMYHMYGSYPAEFAFIQPMCKEPVVYARVTTEERREMMGRVIRMAHRVWQKDWAPKPDSKGCSRCEVKHSCVRFQPVERTGKKRLALRRSPAST